MIKMSKELYFIGLCVTLNGLLTAAPVAKAVPVAKTIAPTLMASPVLGNSIALTTNGIKNLSLIAIANTSLYPTTYMSSIWSTVQGAVSSLQPGGSFNLIVDPVSCLSYRASYGSKIKEGASIGLKVVDGAGAMVNDFKGNYITADLEESAVSQPITSPNKNICEKVGTNVYISTNTGTKQAVNQPQIGGPYLVIATDVKGIVSTAFMATGNIYGGGNVSVGLASSTNPAQNLTSKIVLPTAKINTVAIYTTTAKPTKSVSTAPGYLAVPIYFTGILPIIDTTLVNYVKTPADSIQIKIAESSAQVMCALMNNNKIVKSLTNPPIRMSATGGPYVLIVQDGNGQYHTAVIYDASKEMFSIQVQS